MQPNESRETERRRRAEARAALVRARDSRRRLVEDMERLCADAGITQRALAAEAGLAQPYVSRILAGRARPTLETYAKLAAALGADLSTRLYPNTGPPIRDRHQARILEALLAQLDPRWKRFVEVAVRHPSRGVIDAVLHEPRAAMAIAVEIQSDLRRIEQTVRWSREKAEALPSWSRWPTLDPSTKVSQLLVVRRTRSTDEATRALGQQLAVAFPAHPEDALDALFGGAPWPGATLVWAELDGGGVRFRSARRTNGDGWTSPGQLRASRS